MIFQTALEIAVDTAIVLALDVSGSMTDKSYELQREAVANAMEWQQFQMAARTGPIGRIAVAVVQWGDTPHLMIPWTILQFPYEFKAFAKKIDDMPRAEEGSTCMAKAMEYSVNYVLQQSPNAGRMVIDISGDGEDNCRKEDGVSSVNEIRDYGVSLNVTFNGLPIATPWAKEEEFQTLVDWYRDNVMGGLGAFIMPTNNPDAMAHAMRDKLTKEIAWQ